MNPDFSRIIGSSDDERRGLFLTTAGRMGTQLPLIEKDFWVCWTLDALFNGLPKDRPRLLFKGGTSLSKAFDLIKRFSEDIDLVVFRDDIGQAASIDDLEQLPSKTKRNQRLDGIKRACQKYIEDQMLPQLRDIVTKTMTEAKIDPARFNVELHEGDPDGQSIRFTYPSVNQGAPMTYIETAVKIEAGARSALDPHQDRVIVPYVAEDFPDSELAAKQVTTVEPSRTFWDKIVILHTLRQRYDRKHELLHGGQRVSRHYMDVHALLAAEQAENWLADRDLGEDCVRHAAMFFGSPYSGLDLAKFGSFTLTPGDAMREELARDYDAMQGMIFGTVPPLDDVLGRVTELEKRLNS